MLEQTIFRPGSGEGRDDGQVHACGPRLYGRRISHISHVQCPGADGLENGRTAGKIGQLQLKAGLLALTAGIQQMTNQLALISDNQPGPGVCRSTCGVVA
ncbi:hypothetical protein P606_13585 [Comamonas thiooxydans]|nr:hypothetical protein P606_13585 [Comamonas thiooxydans]